LPKIVSILTFHHITPIKDSLTIPPSLFEETLYEVSKKYNFISYKDFTNFILTDGKLPNKAILLNLDDGYLDNYIYAYPILKKLNIPAIIFIITNNIKKSFSPREKMPYFKTHKELDKIPDKNLFINTTEINEMLQSNLIEIESHTQSHFICKNKTYKEVSDELDKSLLFIKENIIKKEHYCFCWPRGLFDKISLSAIEKSSYEFAFSTIDGAFHKGDNLYTIKRIDCSSWNGDKTIYLKRIKRKLAIYSNPIISKFYSDFREYRIKKRKSNTIK